MTIPARFVPAVFAFATLVALAAVSPAHAAWSSDPYAPNVVCSAGGDQFESRLCSDGAGGVFVVWTDTRGGGEDVYAQHLDAHGTPTWAANGVVVCNAVNNQINPVVCTDGAGGCFVAWRDFRNSPASGDLAFTRLSSSGAPAVGWAANGAFQPSAQNEFAPRLAADGAGGAYIAFSVQFSGSDYDPNLVHTDASGVLWSQTGTSLTNIQLVASLVVTGGNAVVIWSDNRSGSHYEPYFQAWNGAGAALLPANGVRLATAATDLADVAAAATPAGGFVYAYDDGSNVFAGVVSAGFGGITATTVASSLPNARYVHAVASDAHGGGFVVWSDYRANVFVPQVFATHLLPGAYVAPGWATNGNAIFESPSSSAIAASDGGSGVFVGCTGSGLTYIQHLDGSGAPWPMWPSSGRVAAVSNLFDMTTDGAGNAILSLDAFTSSANFDVFAQRVDRFGAMGEPAPAIVSVKDAKNDQGGHLKVSWNASTLDVAPDFTVTAYDVWRSVPAAYATKALRSGARRLAAGETPSAVASAKPPIMIEPAAAQTIYWEYVGEQTASASAGYSYVVPTLGDSIGGSNPYTLVRVRALPTYTTAYWESAPDSGYSVDNLPPVAPAPFAGNFVKGTGALLTWGPNAEGDLAGYRLYRGTSSSFVPNPANRIAQLATTNFTDAGAPPAWYKLTSYDIHGNESLPVTATLSGTTDVDLVALPREVFLAPVSPNPVRTGTTLRFGLPRESRVTLALYDAAGRRVRALEHGTRPAGEHTIAWDGRDDAGEAVASGLYFLRLETSERSFTRRLALVR